MDTVAAVKQAMNRVYELASSARQHAGRRSRWTSKASGVNAA